MKRSIFSQISTKPSKNALKWAGREHSILSNILLWTLWICRVLSLLQISKLIYRKLITFFKRSSTDKNSVRPNVPPMFCEIYFILWFCVFLAAHLLGWHHIVITILIYYYLFESVVWVLYYTIFRRFYEENYSIYHELEYLTVLILLIPTQALAFAILYRTSFREMLSGLLGAGEDGTPFAVRVLGALFAAIVISMIISAFPAEAIKKKQKKQKMIIIGNGDVVKERLYPALRESGSPPRDIRVFDKGAEDASDETCTYYEEDAAICDAVLRQADTKSIVFIETPTHTHYYYLERLIGKKIPLIVVEKPITASLEELDAVHRMMTDDDKREQLFFMSYYILEKALPLYYLTSQITHYEKYLDIDDTLALHNWRLRLGILQSVKIDITEGEDLRTWVQDRNLGGQLLETFIHNVLIASLFSGLPSSWCNHVLEYPDENSITLTAESGKANICLHMVKNAPTDQLSRTAEFNFSGGNITADFDTKSAKIYFDDLGKAVTIAVKDTYATKYSVLVDLIQGVTEGDYRTTEVDGLKNQPEVIEWLLTYLQKEAQ